MAIIPMKQLMQELGADEEQDQNAQPLQPSQSPSIEMPTQPFRTEFTQATGRGSTDKMIDPAGMMQEQQLKNQMALELENQKSEINQIYKARATLDEYSSDAMQALIGIDKLSRHAEELGDFDRGFLPQTYAKIKTGLDTYGKEKNITRYLGVLAQELIPFARKLMEEKGPITEFDIARVEKGLGDLTTPLEDKKYLLEELRSKVGKALQSKIQVAQIKDADFRKKYALLSSMAFPQGGGGDQDIAAMEAELAQLEGRTK